MKMKVTYIANDGTEFENKEECIAHETSLVSECDFIQLYDHDGKPIKWNPDNYDDMWNHLYYIVIEPHREKEVDEWWRNTFYAMLRVSPFDDIASDWLHWLRTDHGDEPTILAYDFNSDDDWVILNEIYSKVRDTIKSLDLVDALS